MPCCRCEYGVAYERPARAVNNGKLGEPIEQVTYAAPLSNDLIWQGSFELPDKDTRTTMTTR